MSQDPLTKLNAIALISIESGKSRRMVEATLKELTENGTIRMEKSPHASVIYISRADVEKVIKHLKPDG